MANYRVKSATGPWAAGDVVGDEDVKGWEAGGGIKRLRDQLGSLEDTTDERKLASEPAKEGDEDLTTGNTKPGASTAADIGPGGAHPNAKASPRAGKS